MSEALANGIASKLTADQASGSLYDDLGGRIYEAYGPEEGDLPQLTWLIVSDPPAGSFEADGIDAEIEFNLWGERRLGEPDNALGDINDKLFNLLHRGTLTISGHGGTNGASSFCLERGQRIVDEMTIRITSRYGVRAP